MKCRMCGDEAEFDERGTLCEECESKPRHRYHALLRPPGFAAVPDHWVRREIFHRPLTVEENLRTHGWVEYAEPLPFETAWRFDLLPADEDEERAYNRWYREEKL